jgi:predicted RND superfamily exporter protein
MTDPGTAPDLGDGRHVPRGSGVGMLAGRLARWAATRPRQVLCAAAVVLVLSLVSLGQLHITSSLAAMLGTQSITAAAMDRVTTGYQTRDSLLLLVELPEDRAADDAARAELVEFATRLEAAVTADPALAPMVAWVKFREDPAFLRFAQEVMLPNGAFYLNDAQATELMRRLDPASMREQFARNEAMIGAPGPAGAALSAAVLRDPLRLFELIPEHLRPDQSGVGMAGDAPQSAGDPEFSVDGRALLVHIGSANVGSDYIAASRLVDAMERLAAKVNVSHLRVSAAGPAAIARDSSRVIRRDSVVSCLVSIALLYVLFFVFYRRWAAGLIIGGVAAVGMLAGVGILALFKHDVSPLAATIAALLAGLGTDYGIHFLSHYDGLRDQGMSSVDASFHTARHMGAPIVTNCFTSIFGFISLWPSEIQMLSDFAVMGAAGLAGALVAVFVLMPAALAFMDRRAHRSTTGRAPFGALADVVAARPRTCMTSSLVVLGVVLVAAAAQGFPLRFETDLTVMHPRPSPSLDATGEVIRRFSGQGELIPIEVRATSPDQLIPLAHDAARALESPACRDQGVIGVMGLHTLLPDPRGTAERRSLMEAADPQRVLASFDDAVEASVFAPEAYTGYREFLRTLVSSRQAPTIQDLLGYRGVADRVFSSAGLASGEPPSETVLLVRLAAPLHDRLQRRATIAALNQAAATVTNGVVTVAGIAAVSTELEEATRDGLPQSIAISLALVVAWLTLVFRRPADVLLALMPLVFASGTTVLFIIAIGETFNPINSVAIPLLSGISVDTGVFLVSVRRTHSADQDQLREHLRPTTHAVLLSSGTTVTAFLALCFTHTPAVRMLGFVSAVGIVASGIGALLLLMPILIRRTPRRAGD